jgi:hypothetical protein
MAFGDPNGHNRYASYQSYGGWGDIHFSGPDGNEDLHGVAGKAMVLITSSDAQVNASTARWHGSPATVATGYYAQVRGADGALYKISMPMNQSVTVTKNGANVSLHGGRNILTKNLAIDMHAKNCTIYTSRFSFSNYDAREYKNLSMAVTGGACERGNCLGGFLGRKAARGLTGSPAGFREGINPYSSAFNVDSVWTTADSFQHTLFPVQDEAGGKTTLALVPGKTYMPVDQALAAGLFKRPNGQKAYKPSQVCGAGSSPADDVKPTDQGHAQQGPDHMGTPVKDALAH